MIARFVLIILSLIVLTLLHLENIWEKERYLVSIVIVDLTVVTEIDVVEAVLVLLAEDIIAQEADLGLVKTVFLKKGE